MTFNDVKSCRRKTTPGLLACILVLCLQVACDSKNSPQPENSLQSLADKKRVYHNDYQIGVYRADASGFYSNCYWIEGPEGVVLIDTQYQPQAALQALKIAESVTGKAVVMAIVTHADADKYNGVAALKARGIKVVSSRQVVEQIQKSPPQERQSSPWEALKPGREKVTAVSYAKGTKHTAASPDMAVADAALPDIALPDIAWNKSQRFSAAGLDFMAYLVRGAMSEAHVLIGLDKHLFVGDLVSNRYHAWLGLGRSHEWLERLEEVRKFARPQVIHPGRGYAMDAESLLSQQELYLHFVRKTVAQFYSGGKMGEEDLRDMVKAISSRFPDYSLVSLLSAGLEAEWERRRQDDHRMM